MILIYTDGSNSLNGKPESYGGYGYVIKYGNMEIQGGGYALPDLKYPVTNNKMEMMGPISAMEFILKNKLFVSDKILIRTDSQYVVKTYNKEYTVNRNSKLWVRFNKVTRKLKKLKIAVNFEWVRGHNGDYYNEMVDGIANDYRKIAKSKRSM